MVRIYFPELEEKISMATEPEETRMFYGCYVMLVFSFLLKGAPVCEGMRSLYLYNT